MAWRAYPEFINSYRGGGLNRSRFKTNWNVAKIELENAAIANALRLEAARATPVLSRFNYHAMSNLKSLNLSIAVCVL